MAVKQTYQVDFKEYEDFYKILKDLGRQAGLTEKEIDQLAKSSEDTFKGVNKQTQQMPGNFGKIGSAVKGVGVAMVASFALEQLIDFGKELLNIEREFTKLRGQIQRFSNETGKDLDKSTAKVKALSNTFGKDLNEILTSANAFAKQTGISFTQSLDLIEKGFLKGADTGGKFLDKIKEYPVQFREAGFTADEFIKIATQEANSGIYSDKLLDTIKELGLSLRELTKAQQTALKGAFGEQFTAEFERNIRSGALSTKDAFFLIAEEARKVGLNVQQTQTLTADLFKAAGEDAGGFEEVIKQVNLALDQNLDTFDALGKKQAETLGIQEEYNSELNKLSKNLEGAGTTLENFWTQSLTLGASAINQLIEFFDIGNARAKAFAANVASGFTDLTDDELNRKLEVSTGLVKRYTDDLQFLVNRGFADKVKGAFDVVNEGVVEDSLEKQKAVVVELNKEIKRREVLANQKKAEEAADQARAEREAKRNALLNSSRSKEEESKRPERLREEVDIILDAVTAREKLGEVAKIETDELERRNMLLSDLEERQQAQRDEALIAGQEYLDQLYTNVQIATEAIGSSAISLGEVVGGGFGNFLSSAGQIIGVLQSIAAAQQAIALAKQAEKPFPANVVAIAATLGAITQAVSTVKNISKFATGTERVEGPGTRTSDSVPALLSKDERVVKADTNMAYFDSLNMITREKISPEEAKKALDMARDGSIGNVPSLALGVVPSGKVDNSDVVKAINKQKLNVNVRVDNDGVSIEKSRSRQKRLNRRYSFNG